MKKIMCVVVGISHLHGDLISLASSKSFPPTLPKSTKPYLKLCFVVEWTSSLSKFNHIEDLGWALCSVHLLSPLLSHETPFPHFILPFLPTYGFQPISCRKTQNHVVELGNLVVLQDLSRNDHISLG